MNTSEELSATIHQVQDFGIWNESPEQIDERLKAAVDGIASSERRRDMGGMSLPGWVGKRIRDFKKAVHEDLCDSEKGELKEKYQDFLKKGLTIEGVSAVAAVVSKIVASINPAYAVSTVAVYLAIWLLKVGLNSWCSRTPDSQ